MEIPRTISPDEATKLIVDCDAAIMSGADTSNRTKPISKCMECGVKFVSERFRACPICSVHNARHIDLQDDDQYERARRLRGFGHPAGGIRRSADITGWTEGLPREGRKWYVSAFIVVGIFTVCIGAWLGLWRLAMVLL